MNYYSTSLKFFYQPSLFFPLKLFNLIRSTLCFCVGLDRMISLANIHQLTKLCAPTIIYLVSILLRYVNDLGTFKFILLLAWMTLTHIGLLLFLRRDLDNQSAHFAFQSRLRKSAQKEINGIRKSSATLLIIDQNKWMLSDIFFLFNSCVSRY